MSNSANNKRIAKNTLLLYLRMFIGMSVSLYTSRVVLNALGVDDYGIFNVVGGVVAMFSFINSSMGSATSRFLTFGIGKGDQEELRNIFSTALIVHIIIAGVIFVLGETVGLWFLENKLVISPERMNTARILYQFSILSTVIGITQVPYNALIIAHERMNIYAYMELLNVFIRLGVVWILLAFNGDRLLLYATLTLLTSTMFAIAYRAYCIRSFTESRFKLIIDKPVLSNMLSFSGWDLYGNMSVVARTQGVNMLINVFFGTAMNAAAGIAGSVQGSVMAFASNILTAIRPQIVKSYASGDYKYMSTLIYNASKYSFILLLLLSLPLMIEMPYVLRMWLKLVPDYAVDFTRWTLVFNFVANMSSVVISGIHATGKIKRPSLINGSLYMLVVPISYIFFMNSTYPVTPYIINALFVFIGCLSNVYTLSKYVVVFSFITFIKKVLLRLMPLVVISTTPALWVSSYMSEGLLRLVCVVLTTSFFIIVYSYLYILDKETIEKLRSKIYSCIRK
ncbi:MAG: lipopolysaccharide biosynthesis protein [Phocaeicola sp.]